MILNINFRTWKSYSSPYRFFKSCHKVSLVHAVIYSSWSCGLNKRILVLDIQGAVCKKKNNIIMTAHNIDVQRTKGEGCKCWVVNHHQRQVLETSATASVQCNRPPVADSCPFCTLLHSISPPLLSISHFPFAIWVIQKKEALYHDLPI